MKLKLYLSVRGRQSQIAQATGLAPAYIWQIANGVRPAPVVHCLAIENATNGEVSRIDLRPDDWRLIWPELVDREAA